MLRTTVPSFSQLLILGTLRTCTGLSQKQTNLVHFHADVKEKVRGTRLKEPNVRGTVPHPGCRPGSQERTPACAIQFQERE